MTEKRVLIIGGGVAGLTTALELTRFGIESDIVEKSPFAGGHGIQFACKATDRCVKCGACVVEEKLRDVCAHPGIRLLAATEVMSIEKKSRFSVTLRRSPVSIDPAACNDCGACFTACPEGAVQQGFSAAHNPFYGAMEDRCSRSSGSACTICRDACPQQAISFSPEPAVEETAADAVIAAHGFTPFAPIDKPYGYGMFDDVVTNLELERMLRRKGLPLRPSNNALPEKIAFIQCVGSRDAKRGHLWCSKICCGSALRLAGLIRHRHPQIEATVFYIDIQTFGKGFDAVYPKYQEDLRFVRAIPADVLAADDGGLKVVYAADGTHESREEEFDLVSLSVGITPCTGAEKTLSALGIDQPENGFSGASRDPGVFLAGAATGPMSIAESVADAGRAAIEAAAYLAQ
ncbi:MAG: FAD-dependent oxidoreductase [Desulfobacterales bacterium]|nr:FAD-dependent oxidoreductase [Desulfobacterales bacterium]